MANLTRFDPFGVSAFDPLEDVLQGFFRPVQQRNTTTAGQLKMDVQEDERSYTVHVEIPGVDKENIHVTIDGNHVTIAAEVRREHEAKEGARALRSERYYGKVSRSFALESEIDETQSQANYKDGVLELVLPKKATSAAKKLTVN